MRYFTYVEDDKGINREVGQGTNLITVTRQANSLLYFMGEHVTNVFIRDNQVGRGDIILHWRRSVATHEFEVIKGEL
jgi:hypothetical protein